MGRERDSAACGQGGFTVVELMVTIAVAAILLALAMPSYQDFIQKRQITSASEQITSFIAEARSEAIRRNLPGTVSFNRVGATNWCVGFVLGTAACDCTVTVNTQPNACIVDTAEDDTGAGAAVLEVLDSTPYNLVQLTAASSASGDSAITFDPVRGILANVQDNAQFSFQTANGKLAMQVDVSPGGRVDICSPDSSKPVPGYKSC